MVGLLLLPTRLSSVSHPRSRQRSNVLLCSLHGSPGKRGVPVRPPPHGCLLTALCRAPSPGRGSSAGFCRWTLVHVGLCCLARPLVPSSRTPCLCRRPRPAAVLWASPGVPHPLGWSSVSFFILSPGSEHGKRLDANRTLRPCPRSQEALREGRINTGTNTYSKPAWIQSQETVFRPSLRAGFRGAGSCLLFRASGRPFRMAMGAVLASLPGRPPGGRKPWGLKKLWEPPQPWRQVRRGDATAPTVLLGHCPLLRPPRHPSILRTHAL